MRRWIVGAALFAGLAVPADAKDIVLPAKEPAVTATFPDAWDTSVYETEVASVSADGDIVFNIAIDSKSRLDALIKDSKAYLTKNKVKFVGKPTEQTIDYNGTPGRVQRYEATDKNGKAIIDFVTLDASRNRVVLLTVWGSQDDRETNDAALTAIMKSVTIPAGGGGFWSGGALQSGKGGGGKCGGGKAEAAAPGSVKPPSRRRPPRRRRRQGPGRAARALRHAALRQLRRGRAARLERLPAEREGHHLHGADRRDAGAPGRRRSPVRHGDRLRGAECGRRHPRGAEGRDRQGVHRRQGHAEGREPEVLLRLHLGHRDGRSGRLRHRLHAAGQVQRPDDPDRTALHGPGRPVRARANADPRPGSRPRSPARRGRAACARPLPPRRLHRHPPRARWSQRLRTPPRQTASARRRRSARR